MGYQFTREIPSATITQGNANQSNKTVLQPLKHFSQK